MAAEYGPVVLACSVPHIGGILGALITRKEIKGWYDTLKKPDWRPPNRAFGPVWTTLYTSMGYASYLVWRDGGGFEGDAKLPLALYGSSLALNWLWTPIFFGAHNIGGGLIDIILLTGTVAGTAVTFYSINKTSAYLLIPYLAWLSLATSLNYVVWRDNPKNPKKDA